MEAVILCGIQAAGKSTFYLERFAKTHARLSLDVLKTRAKEMAVLTACLDNREPFVVDNTNVTRAERAVYVAAAKPRGYRIVCYFFPTDPKKAMERNKQRPGKEAVPAAGLFATQKRLQPPVVDEGFDAIFRVEMTEPSGFTVTPMHSV